MDYYSGHINQLIEQLSHQPGIGVAKTARRGWHFYHGAAGKPGNKWRGIRDHRSKNPTFSTAPIFCRP